MTTRSTLLVLVFLCAGLASAVDPREAFAQAESVLGRFPTSRQVLADFGDDPSRRMALMILYRALLELTPVPRSKASSERITDYFRTVNLVDRRYDRLGTASSERRDYYARVSRLCNDGAFARAVLGKYRLSELFAGRPGGIRLGVGIRGSNAAGATAAGFPRAAPYWIAALVAMALLAVPFVLLFDRRGEAPRPSTDETGTLDLPPKLRSMNLLKRRVNLDIASGLVARTELVGEGQRVWVRTTDGEEQKWAFHRTAFPVEEGQLVSLIVSADEGSDERRVYIGHNHTTSKTVAFEAMEVAIRPRVSPLARLGVTAVGLIGMWLGFAAIVYRLAPEVQGDINWAGPLLIGACVVAVIAWVFVGLAARTVLRRRAAMISARGTSLSLFFAVRTLRLTEHFRRSADNDG